MVCWAHSHCSACSHTAGQVRPMLIMRPLFTIIVSVFAGLVLFPRGASAQAHKPAVKSPVKAVEPAPVHFVDIAKAVGVTAPNVYGDDVHKDYIIETTGNGVVIFDYNNDGWPDLFFPNGSTVKGFPAGQAPSAHLYRNNHDGTFTDVTKAAGLEQSGWGQGGCVGDYDNDGNLDLLVTYWGQNRLYHNNGNGTFTDVTQSAGLNTPGKQWTTGCAFTDYDHDGKVDIILARYVDFSYDSVPKPGQGQWCQWKGINVMCGPRGLKGGTDALFHNNGNGTFTDVSQKAGVTHPSGYYGFTPLTADFGHTGWDDVYITDDSTPNILFHNNRNGTFTDDGTMAGVAYNEDGAEQAGMGVDADDYTHSGSQDIVKTNFSDDTPTLYLNHGDGNFDDVTYAAGLGNITRWLGWGVRFIDFDNDGWPDLLIANGHVYPEVDGKGLGTSYREPKVAYYNLHNGKFANITAQAGAALSEPHSSRGMAVADLFNNGRLEAVVNNMNEAPSIYYNTAPVGNFISLQLIGTRANRAALGAVVDLCQGSDCREQEVRSGGGFISQNDLRLHFGLGKATTAEKVVIHWPGGPTETLRNLAGNKFYTVEQGKGIIANKTHGPSTIKVPGTN